MAMLVLRSWDVSCQVARAENPVHAPRFPFGWPLELYMETPADRDLKMSCIDASRRQLQSVQKLGSKLIF
jgi:hypothetical protein